MKWFLVVFGVLCCGLLSGAEQTEKLIRSSAPAMVFTDRQSPLFRAERIASGTRCRVLNWKGEIVSEGRVKDGGIRLSPLPRNYYRIVLPDGNFEGARSFAVVPDPADRRKNRNYSLVTSPGGAFRFFPGKGQAEKAMEFFGRMYLLAGLEIARDYATWSGLERKRGEYDFRSVDQKRTACRKSGVRYLYLLERAPGWAAEGKDGFPSDLKGVYEFGKAIAAHCGNDTAVWEFYNEIESKFSGWEYASALKAFYLGVKAGNPDSEVAIASYCYSTNGHVRLVFRNGVENYFDLFNIHFYDALNEYPKKIADFRKILKNAGLAGKKIWVTESNTKADGDAAIDIGIKGVRAQTFEQELTVAEYVVKSHLIFQQLGVARNFTFILRPCDENGGKRSWGLLRQDLSAKPGFSAFATLTDQLGEAELIGEVDMPEGIRGFLFRQPDRSRSLVLWSESELDRQGDPVKSLEKKNTFSRTLKIKSDVPLRMVEIFGEEKKLSPVGKTVAVKISRFPIYLHGVGEMKVTRRRQAEAEEKESERGACSPVVISMKPMDRGCLVNPTALLVPPSQQNQKMELRLWNLSEKKQTGRLLDVNGVLSPLPETITLNPWECRKIPVQFSASAKRKLNSEVNLKGEFNNVPVGDFVMPYMLLDSRTYTPLTGLGNRKEWKDNIVRGGKTRILPGKEIIRFEAVFPPDADNWVYPKYTPSGKKNRKLLSDAIGIYFEIRAEQKRKSKYNCVWIDTRNKITGEQRQVRRDYFNVSCGEWTENFVPCSLPPEEEMIGFGIGLGPVGVTEVNYELRNIRVLSKEQR